MKVSTFYQACEKSALYDALQGTNPNFEYAKAISQICDLMCTNKNTDTGYILDVLEEILKSSLKSEWFHFSFQKEKTISDCKDKFKRFLDWLGNFGRFNIVDANVNCVVDFRDSYSTNVSLIIEKEDCSYEGIIIHTGKNPFSFKGRSVHTNAENNLYALIAKYTLEGLYPGIVISNVYLTQENDALGDVKEHFILSNSKDSNVHRLFFEQYMSEGELDFDVLYNKISEVLSVEVKKNCYMCPNQALCNSQTLANKPKEEFVEREYKMPVFTDSQKVVINHEKGAMLVVAGPGSGKTATLVGRGKALMDKGIDPDYMLIITFTKDAKKELEERFLSFCNKENLPTISTIHALAYHILRDNAELVGRKYELLTGSERASIIDGLLEAYQPKGLKYGLVKGQNGLRATVSRKLDKYIHYGCDSELFLAEETALGEDFIELANSFVNLLDARNLITFDEQISLCNKFLQNYPEMREAYNSIYQYVMIDEYQDIDADQNEFITLLTKHGNILAVGDDDQNIYGFRGGSNEYMLHFSDTYPNAETVVFNENFRATDALVEASSALIEGNKERIAKSLCAVRKGGTKPIYIEGNTSTEVDRAISDALAKGYKYGDIAVLATKNATLESLKDTLKYPCILERSYLINEPLFVACFYPLALIKSGYKDNVAMLRLCKLFDVPLENSSTMSLYESISKGTEDVNITKLKEFIDTVNELLSYSPAGYLRAIASILDLEGTKAHSVLNELITNERLTLDGLYKKMDEMVQYEDDTKVNVSNIDAVMLITNHESKGREFPVVILVEDGESDTEETKRVTYVAMTRASELLFVLQKKALIKEAV